MVDENQWTISLYVTETYRERFLVKFTLECCEKVDMVNESQLISHYVGESDWDDK